MPRIANAIVEVSKGDPRIPELLASGYLLAEHVWSAELHLAEFPYVEVFNQRYSHLLNTGYIVDEISAVYAEAVYGLKVMNSRFPRFRGANAEMTVTLADVESMWSDKSKVYGCFKDNDLVGVLEIRIHELKIELGVCYVDAEFAGRGIASGLCSFAILDGVNSGVRHFFFEGNYKVDSRDEVLDSLGFELQVVREIYAHPER